MLVGGLRVLGANADGSKHGVFTNRLGTLTNDFFVNLLDHGDGVGASRATASMKAATARPRRSEVDRDARRPDLRLALAAARLRRGLWPAPTRRRSSSKDFVAAWTKVMNADRFDVVGAGTQKAA